MATLQKIRSKGVLLVCIIGLALFAFIAGDAWKVLQPHQGSQNAGEINGNKVSVQDYQKLVDEYSEVVKFVRGTTSLSEAELSQIKDEVWSTLVSTQLIETETEKLGLTVTPAELQAIIDEGTDPMLAQSVFRNEATGKFDRDVLMKFLSDYSNMDPQVMPAQYVEYYHNLYNYWRFLEKNLRQNALVQKYEALISNAAISNPAAAQYNFDGRNNYVELAYAVVPFNSIPDSLIKLTNADLKKVYNERKELYKQTAESRDIKYIDINVVPSQADRDALLKEVNEYANQMATEEDLAAVVRLSASTVPYSEVPRTSKGLPTDVAARLDSATIGEVYGPYYNADDDSYNAFKIVAKTQGPDSIQYRQIQVADQDANRTKVLSDSIFQALKGGADFAEIAKKYNQQSEPVWVAAKDYEGNAVTGDNATYINTLNSMKKGELRKLSFQGVDLIVEVVDLKNTTDKYMMTIVKRPAFFSNDTYNAAYNQLSQFVASNQTLEDLTANAEENGFRLLELNEFQNYSHTIGGVEGTREALRWIFGAKVGEVSQIFECGTNDHLMVVAIDKIHKEGYRPVSEMADILKVQAMNNKKAEKILADTKNVKSMSDALALANVKTDTLKRVTFSAPAYVSKVPASEPALSGKAAALQLNEFSTPVKGNGGIYFVEVVKNGTNTGTFDAKQEQETLVSNASRNLSSNRIIQELFTKGKITDSRYLFF